MKILKFSWADTLRDADKSMGPHPGVETPLTPDELGDLTLVMLCKVLGYMAGDGLSGVAGWVVVY
jgi:hypothetical protein